jgi:hypothetical protein
MLNVIQVRLSCVEVVLILSAVVSAIAIILSITDECFTISILFSPFRDKTPSACPHFAARCV